MLARPSGHVDGHRRRHQHMCALHNDWTPTDSSNGTASPKGCATGCSAPEATLSGWLPNLHMPGLQEVLGQGERTVPCLHQGRGLSTKCFHIQRMKSAFKLCYLVHIVLVHINAHKNVF